MHKRRKLAPVTFARIVGAARKSLRGHRGNGLILPPLSMISAAMQAAKRFIAGRRAKTPRVIPVPKTGGILPIVPIIAALSALGPLLGGAATVAKTVSDIKSSRDKLAEDRRHNRAMESVKVGRGLYLKRKKNGYGLVQVSETKHYKVLRRKKNLRGRVTTADPLSM